MSAKREQGPEDIDVLRQREGRSNTMPGRLCEAEPHSGARVNTGRQYAGSIRKLLKAGP